MTREQAAFERYQSCYAESDSPPWDSGVVPPELRTLAEGETALSPGRALDVGCGTGTSSIYLAQQGWQVTGIDWIADAVTRAQAKAAEASIPAERLRFIRADVTSPDFLAGQQPVELWLDVGCFHSFGEAGRAAYAAHAARLVMPGGTLLLYGWCEHDHDGQIITLEPADMQAVFGPAFQLIETQTGREITNRERRSAWYTLRRTSHADADDPAAAAD